MQEDNHIFQGLRRDNHQIKQKEMFLWDAHNIRLTNRDDSTLFSITNEKGTKKTPISFNGKYLGHCVVDKYLVVFTTEANSLNNESVSHIYRIEYNNEYKKVTLFEGILNLSIDNPIETIGIVENDSIKKVYWIDGINQPRVIIVNKPEFKFGDNISNICTDFTYKNGNSYGIYRESSFDFCVDLKLEEQVTVTKKFGEGIFSPGTIQYALTYYNKYGQESNIFYTTPLQYISFKDRAGSPEDRISNTFNIKVENIDERFEYIRLYSIHRASINGVPEVKQVLDLPIEGNNTITFIDSGTTGATVDPTKLLYIGGRELIAKCFTEKDGTLFLGNIKLSREDTSTLDLLKSLSPSNLTINTEGITRKLEYNEGYYYIPEQNILDDGFNAGFKSNETYRFGIQAQFKNGTWSQPVHIGDRELCTKYPKYESTYNGAKITQYGAQINVPKTLINSLKERGVKKLRGCVVLPAPYERDIICQGILNPTVYNGYNRGKNSPFAQASWFFRPSMVKYSNQVKDLLGGNIEFRHNYALSHSSYDKEIQNMSPQLGGTIEDLIYPRQYRSHFYVDENIVTLNSPDIEFDTSIAHLDLSETELNVLGYVGLDSVYGDSAVTTSSPTIGESPGFSPTVVGYNSSTSLKNKNNGGMVSQYLYKDTGVKIENGNYVSDNIEKSFPIFAWQKEGSINNDVNRPSEKGTRSSVLNIKVISNLKFFGNMTQIDEFTDRNNSTLQIDTPQLFDNTELGVLKLDIGYLGNPLSAIYQGNVDTLITAGIKYPISYKEGGLLSGDLQYSKEPVRMKYKSTPHLMMSLKSDTAGYQSILPRHVNIMSPGYGISYPEWILTGDPIEEVSDGDIFENEESYEGVLSAIGLDLTTNASEENKDYILDYQNYKNIYGKFNGNIFVGNVGLLPDSNDGYGLIPIPFEGEKIFKIEPSTIIKIGEVCTEETYRSLNIKYTFTSNDKTWATPSNIYYIKISSNGHLSTVDRSKASKAPKLGKSVAYSQYTFGSESDNISPYLLIADLRRKESPISNKFGGNSEQAKLQNIWIPAGDPVSIDNITSEYCAVPYKYGDTWFSRYDCLKTYPFTTEDPNQIVEIGSFMCETRVNLNGRYDKNKGILSNINSSPRNFNLLNEVYNQKDNFFPNVIIDKDTNKISNFPNQITWTLQKNNAEDVDSWTTLTMANTLDLNGDKGQITKLDSFNETLLCFQEKALSQILFNSRVQIPTTDGVPIEISNGYKVDGSRLLSGNIGCSNKWAVSTTSNGTYFLDSNTDSIYVFNGQLINLSETNGMDWWVRQNNPGMLWNPSKYSNTNGIRVFNDNKYGDIYFTPGPVTDVNQPEALCYSEQIRQFTSLMSYGGTQAMFNFVDGFYSLRETDGNVKLYENNAGDYNNFYGVTKGWDFSFISNQNPTITKIFDTIELRADSYNSDSLIGDKYSTKSQSGQPFNFIRVKNEYQDTRGYEEDGTPKDVSFDFSNLRKKFRVWRGLIPRNNGTRQRIRNPWAMITLGWKPLDGLQTSDYTQKAIVHDVSVKYTI